MRLPSVHSIVATIFVVLLFTLLAPQTLRAEEIVYQDEIPLHPTTWSESLTVPQFDPQLGDLLEVSLIVNGLVQGDVQYENLGPNAVPVTITHAVTMTVDLPNNNNIVLLPEKSFAEIVPGFDGQDDHAGASGGEFTLEGSETVTLTYSAAADIAPFVGAGDVEMMVQARGNADAQGPGNFFATLLSNSSGAVLTIRYTYTIPGEEPAIVIEKLTNGVDADNPNDPNVPQIKPGDPVTWTYIITNTGNVAFSESEITVTDSQSDIKPTLVASSDNGDRILSPGESWLYRAFGFAENLQLPSAQITVVEGCAATGSITGRAYENIGVVEVEELRDEDPSHYCNPPQPGIVIEKLTNGADADDANGPDVPTLQPGVLVTWTYIVTNTGNVTFSRNDIRVTDSQSDITPQWIAASDDGDALLSPGESWRYQATDVALNLRFTFEGVTTVEGCDPNNSGSTRLAYENIGTVQVDELSASDPSHYCNPPTVVVRDPGIAIVKLTNGRDANNADGTDVPYIRPEETITWTYIVTNTGDVAFTIAEIRVTDSDPTVTPELDPSSDDGDAVLSPGESWIYVATGMALDLRAEHQGVVIVPGCDPNNNGIKQPAYENIGLVQAGDQQASDPSHYCNPTPTAFEQGEEPTRMHIFIPLAVHEVVTNH